MMQGREKILVVEDDSDIRELVQYNFEREGFAVRVAARGEVVLSEARKFQPSLVVLDLMLPGMSGLEVCRLLRSQEEFRGLPIIMLTARSEESDRVVGLELGADDYMIKPFSTRELVARVRALLRRSKSSETPEGAKSQKVTVGPLSIDSDRHEVRCSGSSLILTLAEFKLLRALANQTGRVLTREQLLEHITGGEVVVIDRNVDVHIRAVRKKLGNLAGMIETVRGVGYKCVEMRAQESV